MNFGKFMNPISLRMIALLSYALLALHVFSQNNLSDRLTQVLERQDSTELIDFYKSIDSSQLINLPDSSLFDYHYLGGAVCVNEEEHELAIKHLQEAKKLCDSSLGINDLRYIEIMENLGDEYYEIGEFKKALDIYQEGITKTMRWRNIAPSNFSNLILGTEKCYEEMGQLNEAARSYLDAWEYWPKSTQPFNLANCFPLWQLQQLYVLYRKYESAFNVGEEIKKFIISQVGETHPVLAEELYFQANILSSLDRHAEAVEEYEKALSILKKNNLTDSKDYLYNLGNLLVELIKNRHETDAYRVIKEIKEFSKKNGVPSIYNDALYTAAKGFSENADYDKALSLMDEILSHDLPNDMRDFMNAEKNQYAFNKNLYDSIPLLKEQYESLPNNSKEWFEAAQKLYYILYIPTASRSNIEILQKMYDAFNADPEVGNEFYLWLLTHLYLSHSEREEYKEAQKYAKERFEYLIKINCPDNLSLHRSVNNLIVSSIKSNPLDNIDNLLEQYKHLVTKLYGTQGEEYAIFLYNQARVNQLQGKYEDAKNGFLASISIMKKISPSVVPLTWEHLEEINEKLADEALD